MSTIDERLALLRRTYDAFNRRDVETVLAALDPDVAWPKLLDRTVIRGREAVREYWERQFQQIDPRVEPTGFVSRGDQTTVEVQQVVRDLQGKVLGDTHVAHVYTFRDDQVVAMEVQPAND